MKYNFDRPIDRIREISIKWSPQLRRQMFGADDVIPMGIADMDFETAPAVAQAIRRRAEHQTYGYAYPSPDYLQACVDWQKRRNGWDIRPDWVLYTPGVNMALVCGIELYTQPGDRVIVQSPVYYPYYDYIRRTGREIAFDPLVEREGRYEMDFDGLERLAKDPRTKFMILCSPHNPVGRCWTRQELERVGRICLEHGVMLAVDEIHGDLILNGQFVAYGTLEEELVHGASSAHPPPRPSIWRGCWCRISSSPTTRSGQISGRSWLHTICGRAALGRRPRSPPMSRGRTGWSSCWSISGATPNTLGNLSPKECPG